MTLARTHSGDTLVIADVSVRVRYFFIVAFVLNSLCAGACALPRTSITVPHSLTHACADADNLPRPNRTDLPQGLARER